MFRPHLLKHVRLGINDAKRRCFRDERKPHDPLRILFCGADEFSIHSLRAVRKLQLEKPDRIASLDVVCRPDKRVGRGLKKLKEVPIKSVAQELELPLHQIDSFSDWSLPSKTNLIIAVSFGLLVPSRILTGATYGGLNVHPSMLPQLRGPAPIQHALLNGHTHAGVSLQTMHPTRFDHGMIIAQTPPPGIPIPEDCTPNHLMDTLGQAGAEMLAKSIEDGLFVSQSPVAEGTRPGNEELEYARKILPEDRHINWNTWSADRIIRYDRVLGRLWDATTYQRCYPNKGQSTTRVTFHGPWLRIPNENQGETQQVSKVGYPTLYKLHGIRKPVFAFRTADGQILGPDSATIEGEQKGKGLLALVPALRDANRL